KRLIPSATQFFSLHVVDEQRTCIQRHPGQIQQPEGKRIAVVSPECRNLNLSPVQQFNKGKLRLVKLHIAVYRSLSTVIRNVIQNEPMRIRITLKRAEIINQKATLVRYKGIQRHIGCQKMLDDSLSPNSK